MDQLSTNQAAGPAHSPKVLPSTTTYKFGQVREKLRKAISAGEWKDKLPGERRLATRFNVNPKTISKALTDLVAEGLLDRGVGLGTYIKGTFPNPSSGDQWLLICDVGGTDSHIERLLRAKHPHLQTLVDLKSVRPGMLNRISSVIVLAHSVPDAFIFDLLVRHITVVQVESEVRTFSTHAVLFDQNLMLSFAIRDLIFQGHHKLVAVGYPGSINTTKDLCNSILRCSPDVTIEMCTLEDVAVAFRHGVTGFVCDSAELGSSVKIHLAECDISVPGQASVMAIGASVEDHAVSGYFVDSAETVNAVMQLIHQKAARPTTLWLPGRFNDHGSTGSQPSPRAISLAS